MSHSRILVVTEEPFLHRHVQALRADYDIVVSKRTQGSATSLLRDRHAPQLVVIDATHGCQWRAIEVGKRIRQQDGTTPILLMTKGSDEQFAREVLRSGVSDYLREPFDFEECRTRVQHWIKQSSHPTDTSPRHTVPGQALDIPLIGNSAAMKSIRAYIRDVATTGSNVLITGETGTGKELVAKAIHEQSARRLKPFVCLNCAAIPASLLESELFGYEQGAFTGAVRSTKGKLEQSHGGTILFDEVGDMEAAAQAKVLRAIADRQIYRLGGQTTYHLDIRIIAATNHNLERLMSERRFRSDLYYRLRVADIHIPPLRDRKEDIPDLLKHFIDRLNVTFHRHIETVSDRSMEDVLTHSWPGNVRELKNCIEAAFISVRNAEATVLDVSDYFHGSRAAHTPHAPNERDLILAALLSTNWSRTQAARKLQWSRMTLYRKMAKHAIAPRPLSQHAKH